MGSLGHPPPLENCPVQHSLDAAVPIPHTPTITTITLLHPSPRSKRSYLPQVFLTLLPEEPHF